MTYVANLLIVLVAAEHVYILWIEMFAWTTAGKKTFKSLSPELFEKTKTLAANQGLYNGFLAAGLIWALFVKNAEWHQYLAYFFLGCVITAGVFGAMTAGRSIFFKQALPAIIAVIVVAIAGNQ